MTPEEIAGLPIIDALRPVRRPYVARLSEHAPVMAWHIDIELEEWVIPASLVQRWEDEKADAAETWRKRPLAVGVDSGCDYSCGEVEIAARLRGAGIEAHWISEWSGFPHVACWRHYCIKRNEMKARIPDLSQYDQALRADHRNASRALGTAGGHPDIAAATPEGYVFLEYKGPGDSIRAKQVGWAGAAIERESPRLAYLVVRGSFISGRGMAGQASAGRASLSLVDSRPPELAVARESAVRWPRTPAGNGPQSSSREKLHRRTISDTLKRTRGWEIVSRVDGSIDFTPPRGVSSIDAFVEEVYRAVQGLGYTPTVRVTTGSGGRQIVRVHTPETLAQAPRGAHGA